MSKDNPLYSWALTQASSEPDIYFDEPEESESPERFTVARLIISQLIQASGGDTIKLQSLMCIFAGMSLREAARQCGRSHECVRKHVLSIEDDYPALFEVLDNRNQHLITSLIPTCSAYKWRVTKGKKDKYLNNLKGWCEKKNIPYQMLYHRIRRNDDNMVTYNGTTYKKNY